MVRFSIATRLFCALSALSLASQIHAKDEERPEIPAPEAAPIAMLYDLQSGRTLFQRDVDRRFAPASITKVMTTYVAFSKLKEGDASLRQQTGVRPETFREWSGKGSTMYVPHDAVLTLDQLLHGITTVSGNDASVILAEAMGGSVDNWLALMNDNARRIGMKNSHFGTPNGWPDEGRTFTTARDLVTLGSSLLRDFGEEYRHFYGKRTYTYNSITQNNHDPITSKVDGADGIKTGFTNQAGYGFLGTAEREGRRLMMVVAASDRANLRNTAARNLIEWGFLETRNRMLFAPSDTVATIPVQNGDTRRLDVVSEHGVFATLMEGEDLRDVKLSIRYAGPVVAPIEDGEQVAWLDVSHGTAASYSIPLYASRSVDTANPFERMYNGLAGLFS